MLLPPRKWANEAYLLIITTTSLYRANKIHYRYCHIAIWPLPGGGRSSFLLYLARNGNSISLRYLPQIPHLLSCRNMIWAQIYHSSASSTPHWPPPIKSMYLSWAGKWFLLLSSFICSVLPPPPDPLSASLALLRRTWRLLPAQEFL